VLTATRDKALLGAHLAFLLLAASAALYALASAGAELLSGREQVLAELSRAAARWPTLLHNTAIVCAAAVAISTSFGGIAALLMTRSDVPGRSLLSGAALLGACLPLWTVPVFALSLISMPVIAGSALACGVLYGLAFAPLSVLIQRAALGRAGSIYEEQALLDAGPLKVLRTVTLWRAGFGAIAAGVIVLVLVARNASLADALVVRTFAEEVYTQFALRRTAHAAVFASLPVMGVLLAALAVGGCWYRHRGAAFEVAEAGRRVLLRFGRLRGPAALICLLGVCPLPLFLLVPLLRKTESPAAFVATALKLAGELQLSVLLSAVAASVTVAAAAGLAWFALRTRWGRLILPIALLLLSMPIAVTGVSLIELLNRPGIAGDVLDSPLIVSIGHVALFLPLAILLFAPAAQRVPRELEYAARVDGCGELATMRHVYWPLSVRDGLATWLIVFVLSFGEVECAVLLSPPGWTLASVRTATLIHSGVNQYLAVLALLAVALTIVPAAALYWLLRRGLD